MQHFVTTRDDLREVLTNAQDGDTIRLSGETYRLTSPICLRHKNDLTICGEEGTVLTGSILITGTWTVNATGLWSMKIEPGLDIQQLYIDEKRYTMARYPNEDPAQWLNGTAEDAITPERVTRWRNPAGGYLRALHSSEWGGNDYIIDGKNPDNTLQMHWVGDNNRGCEPHAKYRLVENIFEELDVPGEWFYEKSTGILYVIPEKGTDLAKSTIEAAVCGEMFLFNNCKGISLSNIHFWKTKRMLFCSTYEKITRSDWSIARNGVIYAKNCSDLTISNCNFTEVGGNCIFIDQKNETIIVKDCNFTDCGASGICSFGDQSCVRDLSTWENHRTVVSDPVPGPQNDNYPRNITVRDCYFFNLGIYEKQTAPVTISVSSRVSVIGCTMHHLPRAGLNVCDGSFGGHRFEDNLIFDTVRETGDHGPFNSWGRDRFWSLKEYNTWGQFGHEKRPYALLDAVETTVIAHNMFCGSRGFGIDLDDGSSNYLITKNYCVGVGIKLREGFLRTVRNNFLLDAPLDVHCTFAENDDVIENNIIVSDDPLRLILQNDGYTTIARNNLFAGAPDSILAEEFLAKYKNYTCSIDNPDTRSMHPREIYFEPFSLEFGRKDCPKPEIRAKQTITLISFAFFGANLTSVDDTVRSMAGLPNYEGAYVQDLGEDSPLLPYGLRKSDVILAVNDRPVRSPEDLNSFRSADLIEKIFVIHGQQPLLLTK